MTDIDAHNPEVEHEESDVNIRAIFGFAAGLVATALFIHFGVWVLFSYFSTREAARTAPQFPLAVAQEQRMPPEPRLQTNPRQDLQDLRAQEEQLLNGYRWVDRNAGVIRIPIDEAIRLTLQRGLPARSANQEGK